jgi:hypothetical protein
VAPKKASDQIFEERCKAQAGGQRTWVEWLFYGRGLLSTQVGHCVHPPVNQQGQAQVHYQHIKQEGQDLLSPVTTGP